LEQFIHYKTHRKKHFIVNKILKSAQVDITG